MIRAIQEPPEPQAPQDLKEQREPLARRATKEMLVSREHKAFREFRARQERKGQKVKRETQAHRVRRAFKENLGRKENKDRKVIVVSQHRHQGCLRCRWMMMVICMWIVQMMWLM